ncbi:oxygenase MpaB family protein [Rubrolithibacter danxiaensis]|uniref:oxygenase MpaB family protein n=1 Tax=Rubrolithibacter danxiaensis TaxID=3390805 RepID=UPI003BF88A1B
MEFFVERDSIVRKIWGNGDTILFIFAGASAEFALNKAVDWLYFTGRLPADPLGRLFSTVSYARKIVFSEYPAALRAIDTITAIHKGVEQQRGKEIPDWAYRDVLFMLIDYSIRAFEVLERKLTESEKTEVFTVFYRVGLRMEIKELPDIFPEWLVKREEHIQENLVYSQFTADLYKQYKKHLGWFRYQLLKQAQVLVVPKRVNSFLSLGKLQLLTPVLSIYKLSRRIKLEGLLKNIVLPKQYKAQIAELDVE